MKELVTRVLSYWQPQVNLENHSNENKEVIKQQFQLYLFFNHGIEVTIHSIHSPTDLSKWFKETCNWHQDENKVDKKFIVWSNIQPTDIWYSSDFMLTIEDGAIILINNLEVVHKTPTPVNPKRWLIRTDYLKG